MKKLECEIGLIGLGVMGLNLALNVKDHDYSIACFDKEQEKVDEACQKGLHAMADLKEFIGSLRTPRVILLLIPAGSAVDDVIDELLPSLIEGDILIDGGNSYYKDTEIRQKGLSQQKVHFFGIGISGGEEGARYGPSIMPGGPSEVYERFGPILEAVSAKVSGEPCVAYLGPRSAGHFVKMVHNGIEYGLMQLISETYDLLKRGLNLDDDALSEVYASWNKDELESYLLEITAEIFKKVDQKSSKKLIDVILDVSKQKGTGMWTTQSAMELHIPSPLIDVAVGMRHLSMQKEMREKGSSTLKRPIQPLETDRSSFIEKVRQAYHLAMMVAYAQGMAILDSASKKYKFNLDLETVAKIWRGGCIIRSTFLENMREAYKRNKELSQLLFDPQIAQKTLSYEDSLRSVIKTAIDSGIPLPGFMSALNYLDGIRSGWLPANLIQAQRDYFGSHSYERIDEKGTFHTKWESGEKTTR